MALRLAFGFAFTAIGLALVGRRAWWLYRLVATGKPVAGAVPQRARPAEGRAGRRVRPAQAAAQDGPRHRPLLHLLGASSSCCSPSSRPTATLFSKTFAIPVIGHWRAIGFVEDFFGTAVLFSLLTFTIIRIRQNPASGGPQEPLLRVAHRRRVAGPAADLRGHRHPVPLPGGPGPHRRLPLRQLLVAVRLPPGRRRLLRLRPRRQHGHRDRLHPGPDRGDLGLLRVRASTPSTCTSSCRSPTCCSPGAPRGSGPLGTTPDIDPEKMTEDTVFGIGTIGHLTWKQRLDLISCTECGRCQDQCPAWATDKPLSPKMIIMDLRDHLFASADELLAKPANGNGGDAATAAARAEPLREQGGQAPGGRRHRPRRAVVVHLVRVVRRAVPGRHRAPRHHHGHAPLPGAHGGQLPDRGRPHAAQHREPGRPLGPRRSRPAWSGPRAWTSRSRW